LLLNYSDNNFQGDSAMKKLSVLILGLLIAGISQTAFAIPYLSVIPDGVPLYFKFNAYEQISQTGSIVSPSGATEQNWGILNTTSIAVGDLSNLPSGTGSVVDSQLYAQGQVLWAPTPGQGQVTGIFWGVKPDSSNTTDPVAGTGGYLDLYYDSSQVFNSAYNPSNRTADNMYTGATSGIFLARIDFLDGAISTYSSDTSIVGSVVPSPSGFTTGVADSFGVVDTNVVGAWTNLLNGNGFNTLLGDNTADIRFKNSYNPNANWNGPTGSDIVGATADDPARVFSAVPEPATLLLLGIGILGLAGVIRKNVML
jgi:hypothetical protein